MLQTFLSTKRLTRHDYTIMKGLKNEMYNFYQVKLFKGFKCYHYAKWIDNKQLKNK